MSQIGTEKTEKTRLNEKLWKSRAKSTILAWLRWISLLSKSAAVTRRIQAVYVYGRKRNGEDVFVYDGTS